MSNIVKTEYNSYIIISAICICNETSCTSRYVFNLKRFKTLSSPLFRKVSTILLLSQLTDLLIWTKLGRSIVFHLIDQLQLLDHLSLTEFIFIDKDISNDEEWWNSLLSITQLIDLFSLTRIILGHINRVTANLLVDGQAGVIIRYLHLYDTLQIFRS